MVTRMIKKIFDTFRQQKNKTKGNISAFEYNKLENVNRLNSDKNHFLDSMQIDSRFIEYIYPLIKANIKDRESSVLDVGCGTGILVNKLVLENISQYVYGCDFSVEKIELCKEIYNNEDYFVHDIYAPLNDSYDVIICTEVLEHLKNPEDAVHNLLSFIKISGKLIISVPDGRKDVFSGHIHFWSPESFQIFIEKCLDYNQDHNYNIRFVYIDNKNVCIIQKLG